MIYGGFFLLLAFAIMFSRHEMKIWGSRKTPFAFVVYPFLALLSITVFVGPSLGFYSLHPETVLVIGLFFSLFAIASLSTSRVWQGGAVAPARLQAMPEMFRANFPVHRIGTLEYLIVGGIIVLFFASTIASRGGGDVAKGELGVGGIGGHLVELGIAYLVIATSDGRGQRLLRMAFAILVLWLLAINQVKALIFLPLSAAVLYRWAFGYLAAWKVAVIAVGAPLALGIAVYAYFGANAAVAGFTLTPAMGAEIARHLMAYLMAGIIGLDQLLRQVNLVAFGGEGVEYALAPFINLTRFLIGAGNYYMVVNPLYVIIHPGDMIDSNVFTLFGSVLYRGGWVGATAITLAYAMISYWIWSRWRAKQSPLACAAGSWWMTPLLFAWFDPYFTTFSFMEVMIILAVRGSFSLPRLRGAAARAAAATISA
jgi:hypothetical protein